MTTTYASTRCAAVVLHAPAIRASDGSPRAAAALAQGPEACAHLVGEQLRLFPGREVAAPVDPVVVDEVVGIGPLGPAAGRLVELLREDADGVRDRDRLGLEEACLFLPVKARGGDPRVRQPVQRDVVQDVVAGEVAATASLEDPCDQPGLAGAVAVVDREGSEIDR